MPLVWPFVEPAPPPTPEIKAAEATVTGVWQISAGSVLVMLLLNNEKLDLPMLGRVADDWAPCDGKLKYGSRVGLLGLTENGRKNERLLAGPIFDCRELYVWETGSGSPADLLAMGRDLGIRRHQNFSGHALVGYVAPKWREALRLYLPALEAGHEDAMSELVDLIQHQASGWMQRDRESSLIRLKRKWRALDYGPARDAAFDEMLELLIF